jgi:hypothetical protein
MIMPNARILHSWGRLVFVLLLLLLCGLPLAPTVAEARVEMSAGESGDPTDGELLSSGGGNASDTSRPPSASTGSAQPEEAPGAMSLILLLPVLGPAGALCFIVHAWFRTAGGGR